MPLPVWHILILLGVLVVLFGYYHSSSQPSQKTASAHWFSKIPDVAQQPPALLAMTNVAEEQWQKRTEQPLSGISPVSHEQIATRKVAAADITPASVKPASIPVDEITEMAQHVTEKIADQPTAKATEQHFTVQLLSGANPDVVQSVIDQHPQVKSLHMLKSKQAGEPRYLLLYGDFVTREAAEAAVSHIPPDILQGKPWIRAMRDSL